MTDNEIIKALECCGSPYNRCLECPLCEMEKVKCFTELTANALDLINRQKAEINNLENLVAINKGAMRAYREACENAHDEAVADFSHFLIDKAKDRCIDICDLPDLVAEWRSPERKDAELMKEINGFFDKAAEGLELSSEEKNKENWLRTATGWYDARFRKVE